MKTKTELLAMVDRVTAERDAALARVAELESDEPEWSAMQQKLGDANVELQQRLAAADERADVLEGLLREVSSSCALIFEDHDATVETVDLQDRIDAALKPAEGGGDA